MRNSLTVSVVPTASNSVIRVPPQGPAVSFGIFFDGTGNNKNDPKSAPTNISRLWSLYPDAFRVYVRGVGTEAHSLEDFNVHDQWGLAEIAGSAGGWGTKPRIGYAFQQLELGYRTYRKVQPHLPVAIRIDVFGFSRGAASARHFVNLLNELKTSGPDGAPDPVCQELSSGRLETRFLGLFDTVGSIGKGGDDHEAGYEMHVDNDKARFIYHLVSEDELRANFPLTSIWSRKEQDDKPVPPRSDRWMIEEHGIGVHSDIGGGYADRMEHANDDSRLSLVYLAKMHAAALKAGVPFPDRLPPEHLCGKEIGDRYARIEERILKDPKVRACHRKLREARHFRDFYLEYAKHNLRNPEQSVQDPFRNESWVVDTDGWTPEARVEYCKRRIHWLEVHRINPMRELLAKRFSAAGERYSDFEADCFLPFFKQFVHRSHRPFNNSSRWGMWPRKEKLNDADWPLSELSEEDKANFRRHENVTIRRETFYPPLGRKAVGIPWLGWEEVRVKVRVIGQIAGQKSEPGGKVKVTVLDAETGETIGGAYIEVPTGGSIPYRIYPGLKNIVFTPDGGFSKFGYNNGRPEIVLHSDPVTLLEMQRKHFHSPETPNPI